MILSQMLEVMVGVKDSPEEDLVRKFLAQFEIHERTSDTSEAAVTNSAGIHVPYQL